MGSSSANGFSNTLGNLRMLESTVLKQLAQLPPVEDGQPDLFAHKRSSLTNELIELRADAFVFAEDHATIPLENQPKPDRADEDRSSCI